MARPARTRNVSVAQARTYPVKAEVYLAAPENELNAGLDTGATNPAIHVAMGSVDVDVVVGSLQSQSLSGVSVPESATSPRLSATGSLLVFRSTILARRLSRIESHVPMSVRPLKM